MARFSRDGLAIARSSNRGLGVEVEGCYEFVGWGWVLREWRVLTEDGTRGDRNPDPINDRVIVGRWHKVHGNQKKAIGSLKLVRDTLPPLTPSIFENHLIREEPV